MIKIRIQTTSGDPKGWLRREFWHAQSSVYAILMQAICSHKCFKFFLNFYLCLHVMQILKWAVNYHENKLWWYV